MPHAGRDVRPACRWLWLSGDAEPALGLWWYGHAFDDVREHRSQVFGARRRFVVSVAGRAQVIRRASRGREESVAVADYYVSAVTLASAEAAISCVIICAILNAG